MRCERVHLGQRRSDPASDPCITGPRLAAGSGHHTIATVAASADRESYTRLMGDPPVLQISRFATGGKLDVPVSFVEAAEAADETAVHVQWTAPKADTITAETPVAFTFVTRQPRWCRLDHARGVPDSVTATGARRPTCALTWGRKSGP